MRAYTEAAKRMFWPIVSSTATTLCAFLPMLFWPGVPGEFMGMLPVTLIFVLSASLVVALIYLPVMGGVAGPHDAACFERAVGRAAARRCPGWCARLLVPVAAGAGLRRRDADAEPRLPLRRGGSPLPGAVAWLPGVGAVPGSAPSLTSITLGAGQDRSARRGAIARRLPPHALRPLHPAHRRQPGDAAGHDRRRRRPSSSSTFGYYGAATTTAWSSSSRASPSRPSSTSARAATCQLAEKDALVRAGRGRSSLAHPGRAERLRLRRRRAGSTPTPAARRRPARHDRPGPDRADPVGGPRRLRRRITA